MSRRERFLLDLVAYAIAIGFVVVLYAVWSSERGHTIACAGSMKPCP